MVNFPRLHEPALLNNIRQRYADDDVYKGGQILVVNPKLVRDKLEVVSTMSCACAIVAHDLRQTCAHLVAQPHVFETAKRRLSHSSDAESRSVIVSGESGAGKTETTKRSCGILQMSKRQTKAQAPRETLRLHSRERKGAEARWVALTASSRLYQMI